MNNTPNTTTVLDNIAAFIERFVAFADEDHAAILATYVLHTHCFDSAEATPYLYITSAGPQSGKSTLLDVMTELVHNPMKAGSITGAAMFKAIESARPTILFDEVDTIFTGAANEALRGILNDGYKRSGAVYRSVPGQDEPQRFSTFGPKMLAGIDNGAMPRTIADRSITIVLKRMEGRSIERFVSRRLHDDIAAIKEEIALWVAAHADEVAANEPKDIETIPPRKFEIAEPLLQIASQVKGWTPKMRTIIGRVCADEIAPLGINAQCLVAAKELTEDNPEWAFIFSDEIAEKVAVSTTRLGRLLAPYGIKSTTVRRDGAIRKGYRVSDFAAAWEKML